MNIPIHILEFVDSIKLMQLATASGNQPWLCNVWYVLGDQGQLYWMSRLNRRYSLEIENNEKAACTIHGPYNGGLGEKGQALIISGNAQKLASKQCEAVYRLYATRYPKIREIQSLGIFLEDKGPHFFYRLQPCEIVWWDELNSSGEPRQIIFQEAKT